MKSVLYDRIGKIGSVGRGWDGTTAVVNRFAPDLCFVGYYASLTCLVETSDGTSVERRFFFGELMYVYIVEPVSGGNLCLNANELMKSVWYNRIGNIRRKGLGRYNRSVNRLLRTFVLLDIKQA